MNVGLHAVAAVCVLIFHLGDVFTYYGNGKDLLLNVDGNDTKELISGTLLCFTNTNHHFSKINLLKRKWRTVRKMGLSLMP